MKSIKETLGIWTISIKLNIPSYNNTIQKECE